MVHNDYKEMIPAHALSALDAADERVLNEHLAECAECRRDLSEWERTAASLALSAKPMEPSPQLREKLLTQIRSEKSGIVRAEKSGTVRSAGPETSGTVRGENSGSENPASNVIPLGRPSRNLWQFLGSLGSIAAIILFAALLVSVFMLWQQNRELRRENEFFQLINAPG